MCHRIVRRECGSVNHEVTSSSLKWKIWSSSIKPNIENKDDGCFNKCFMKSFKIQVPQLQNTVVLLLPVIKLKLQLYAIERDTLQTVYLGTNVVDTRICRRWGVYRFVDAIGTRICRRWGVDRFVDAAAMRNGNVSDIAPLDLKGDRLKNKPSPASSTVAEIHDVSF